jgi:F0F1-type ATP synthase assembly protein I
VTEHLDGEPPEGKPGQSGLSDLPGVAAFAVMGMTIASCETIGVLLGLWADRSWSTEPVGLVIGIVLGTVAAVVSVVKQVRRFL